MNVTGSDKKTIIFITTVTFLWTCNGLGPNSLCFYKPPAIFSGYINGYYKEFNGNCRWPNTSELSGDTVRLYFFCDSFSEENTMRSGDLLRIDIWPGVEGSIIGNDHILLHMARYHNTNATYTVHPSYPQVSENIIQAKINTFQPKPGGMIELEEFYVRTASVPGTHARELEIHSGSIKGRIDE
ncbi:hypothetical protein QA601_12715 [Chitinispirillales bacterium ANBcel5]|uniref:hypothetical protein n=1 Tax=Cellulosispirillum alkaliphilum TaxID=3039283 RepID=UPI002A529FE5|nr:hypothetical protein [Chitinispirillales bacterium ANBcel5]